MLILTEFPLNREFRLEEDGCWSVEPETEDPDNPAEPNDPVEPYDTDDPDDTDEPDDADDPYDPDGPVASATTELTVPGMVRAN